VELLTDYLDGRLGAEELKRFEAHVAACAHCHEYVEQFQATLALINAAGAATSPAPRAGTPRTPPRTVG
jgi:anti-sigma factor RsiW